MPERFPAEASAHFSSGLVLAIVGAAALLAAPPASAKKGGSALQSLTQDADLIVVGKVVKIVTEGSHRFATLRVDQELKGHGAREVVFVAYPTWSCDESGAADGERVVLFLSEENDPALREALRDVQRDSPMPPLYSITHSGTGRMPIVVEKQIAYALFVASFIVPKSWDELRFSNHTRDATPLSPALLSIRRCIANQTLCT